MGEVMKVNPLDVVILIPSLNPDEKLLLLLQELFEMGFLWIVVVDDGSTPECGNVFRQAEAFGCIVEHHRENLGKGTAIKTALKAAAFRCGCRSGWGRAASCKGYPACGRGACAASRVHGFGCKGF